MAFKMKGFGGFGNSPVKQVKPLVNPKFKKYQDEKKTTRTVKRKVTKPKERTKKSDDIAANNIGELKNTTKRVTDKAKQVKTNNSKIKIPKSVKRPPQDNRPKGKIKGLTGFEYDAKKYLGGAKKFVGDAYRASKKVTDAKRKAIKGVYNYFTKR